MNDGMRTRLLRDEMLRRIDDGWDVVERNPFEMLLVHAVDPPWWRFALMALEPLTWWMISPRPDGVRRLLHVDIDEQGTLSRFTVGDVPPSWRAGRPWEVPDGVYPYEKSG